MYINNVRRREECQLEAELDLRRYGIKTRTKKYKLKPTTKRPTRAFQIHLECLPKETITLQNGQQIAVPKLVHHLCSFILAKAHIEGLFRKEGSRARQNEIKAKLNQGGLLDENNHVIDVAVLLKTFLRELPEPLIPYGYHDLFLRSILLKEKKVEAVLLACLLLPNDYLDTLTYLLQFLSQIADNSWSNKMNATNLAIVISPNAFPIEDKLSPDPKIRTQKTCELFQLLIEQSSAIGVIPDHIIDRVGHASGPKFESEQRKKKKRRSGSLTRMFNGLKKMVGGRLVDEAPIVTPDLLLTPINQSIKKRRIQSNSGLSIKKRKELLTHLPEQAVLNTPFTPQRTPICMNLNGVQKQPEPVKDKKWFARSKSVKNLKQEMETNMKKIERRWSAIGASTNFKKPKKQISCVILPPPAEPDYIRVPKVEYEAIKNRVTAMERRISIELDTVQTEIKTESVAKCEQVVKNVQTAYEQTLEHVEQMSPGTDQLAKRLSRELRIRPSAEQKVIRSPSARKIGSLRRKSLERASGRLQRHQSWHQSSRGASARSKSSNESERKGDSAKISCNLSGSSCDTWTSAEGFFATLNSDSSQLSDRASLAKLRQNAGMVRAKAKLFDEIKEAKTKIGGVRYRRGETVARSGRESMRVRTLRNEERRKKSNSPRRRNQGQLLHRQRMQARQMYLEENGGDKENSDLKEEKFATPCIKRSLHVKSPKRLCRTPITDRSTPLRVLKTPSINF